MNQISIVLVPQTAPVLRDVKNGQVAEFEALAASPQTEDSNISMAVTVWGKQAQMACLEISTSSVIFATGGLRIEKNHPLSMGVTSYVAFGGGPIGPIAFNSVSLVGRAGRDAEVRYFESGKDVANLTLAVNRRSRDDEPDWFNLEIWGKQAEVAADYVRKGSLLGINGTLKLDRWTDRTTGEERSKPVIRVDRLELLGSRRDAEQPQDHGGSVL